MGKKYITEEKYNKILAALSIFSAVAIAALLAGFIAVRPAYADERALDEQILSAAGTQIVELCPDFPLDIEQRAIEAKMDRLATAQMAAHAEKLISSQVSYARDKAEKIKAQREAAEAARAAAEAKAQAEREAASTLDTTRQHFATVSGASGHTDITEQSNGSPSPATPTQAPNTINILGDTIPFVDAYTVTRAPEHGCGIWRGDDLVDDGGMCYFVGHNPGDFHNVMNLQNGNIVTVCDSNGNTKSYVVHDTFTLPQKSTYSDVVSRVEGHGESVVMQTCCGDNVNVRIVIAW